MPASGTCQNPIHASSECTPPAISHPGLGSPPLNLIKFWQFSRPSFRWMTKTVSVLMGAYGILKLCDRNQTILKNEDLLKSGTLVSHNEDTSFI